MLKIIGIKTNNGYLITDNFKNKEYFDSILSTIEINGQKAKPTFKKNWFSVESKPITVSRKETNIYINKRFELKDKSLSDKFKDVYAENEVMNSNHQYYGWFDGIMGLYEFKQDLQDARYIDIPFEFEEILEIEVFKEPSKFNYKCVGKHDIVGYVSNENVKYDFISSIITPDIIKHELPCKLSQKDTYDIIRAYIKDNINPNVAEITSDYDFCFEVKKKIKLAKEHKYQVDVNFLNKRKPKYETRVSTTKLISIFKMCPKPYDSYPVISPFEGSNQDELKTNIDEYLNHLISVINEPLKECSCCNGTGVLLNK